MITQALNRVGLWMLFLFGNLFRQDMHQPENSDANNWRDDENDPRQDVRESIERLAMQH